MGWPHTLFRENRSSGSKAERGHTQTSILMSYDHFPSAENGSGDEKRYTTRKQNRRLEAFIHRTHERSFIEIHFYFVWSICIHVQQPLTHGRLCSFSVQPLML
jgi:hypothetical protein